MTKQYEKPVFERRILAGIPQINPGTAVFDSRLNHYFVDKHGSMCRLGDRIVSKKKAKLLKKQGIQVQSRQRERG